MHPQRPIDDEPTHDGERAGEATPELIVQGLGTADTQLSGDLASASTLGSGVGMRQEPPLPARIGRYLVIERLGAGGMGVVLAAYDPELDRRVAIKLLRAAPGHDAGARLLREAQALARLSHPNVVQIHDAGAHGDRIFLAMELVAGDNLRRWLDAGPRPWRSVLRVFVEAGRGLAAAHAVGIIHRDFKPENVLIGADGRARVADFGLARQASGVASPSVAAVPAQLSVLGVSLTVSGTVLGTPAYMSPEHLDGARADARSDLFSFCVALYEALYGRRPFAGDTLAALLHAVQAGAVAPPPAESRVPRRIFNILRRGLAHDPDARPASLEALLAELLHDPAARPRRLALAVGLLLTGGGIAGAASYVAAPPPCADAGAAIRDLWSPAAARAVDDALTRVGAAPSVAARVHDGLDAYAAGWAHAREGACLDHQRGGDTDAAHQARVRCLDRRRSALESALRLARSARPGDDLVRVVAGLPALDACARVDALLAAPARPRHPAAVALERDLDEARALADAGRHDDAARLLHKDAEAADALGERALAGQARVQAARVAMTLSLWDRAAALLRASLADALAADDPPTAAEAAARLLQARALAGAEPIDAVLADAPIAAALVDRLGPRAFARRRLDSNLSVVHLVKGDLAAARRHADAAVADLAADLDVDPFEAANFLHASAQLTDDPSRRRADFERAESILRAALGDDHRELRNLRFYAARSELDLDRAYPVLVDACARYRRDELVPDPDFDPSCAECGLLLGGVADERGDLRAAADHYDEAATCDAGAPQSDAQAAKIGARRSLARAHAHLLRDRPDLALADVDATLATLAPYFHPDRPWLELQRADALLVAAEAHRARGDLDAARRAAAHAHALYQAHAEDQLDALPRRRSARAARLVADLGDT